VGEGSLLAGTELPPSVALVGTVVVESGVVVVVVEVVVVVVVEVVVVVVVLVPSPPPPSVAVGSVVAGSVADASELVVA
jgi:hypothetical protein